MLFLDGMCTNLLPIIRLIKNGLIPLIQIGIPIILIVLGTIDLGKAVIASKEDEIKNAQKMLVKRAIYAVAIFFVVTIVTLVFSLLATAEDPNKVEDPNATKQETWLDCWNMVK